MLYCPRCGQPALEVYQDYRSDPFLPLAAFALHCEAPGCGWAGPQAATAGGAIGACRQELERAARVAAQVAALDQAMARADEPNLISVLESSAPDWFERAFDDIKAQFAVPKRMLGGAGPPGCLP